MKKKIKEMSFFIMITITFNMEININITTNCYVYMMDKGINNRFMLL